MHPRVGDHGDLNSIKGSIIGIKMIESATRDGKRFFNKHANQYYT